VQKKWKRLLLVFGALLLSLYVGSYLALSRRGYAEADHFHMKGFYYCCQEDSDAWRLTNYGWLGFGRQPASEPLWGLSREGNAEPGSAPDPAHIVCLGEFVAHSRGPGR
jgi:hypothetical protein